LLCCPPVCSRRWLSWRTHAGRIDAREEIVARGIPFVLVLIAPSRRALDTPDATKNAADISETNPTWKWTDQDPRTPR
jgi:hypothetical protein